MSERLKNRIQRELVILATAINLAKKKMNDVRAEQSLLSLSYYDGHQNKKMKTQIAPLATTMMDKHQVAITTMLLPSVCNLDLISEIAMFMTKLSADVDRASYELRLTHLGQRVELVLQKYTLAMVHSAFANLRSLLLFVLPDVNLPVSTECSALNVLKFQKDVFHVLLLVIIFSIQPKLNEETGDSGRILHDKVSVLCSVARDGILHIIKRYGEKDAQLLAETGMVTVDHSLKMVAQEWSLRVIADAMLKTHHCFPISSALHCIAEDIEFGLESK